MSLKENDINDEARGEWLKEKGLNEFDVMSDEQGEYVMDQQEVGHPTEAGSMDMKKVYLPDNLQKGNDGGAQGD